MGTFVAIIIVAVSIPVTVFVVNIFTEKHLLQAQFFIEGAHVLEGHTLALEQALAERHHIVGLDARVLAPRPSPIDDLAHAPYQRHSDNQSWVDREGVTRDRGLHEPVGHT